MAFIDTVAEYTGMDVSVDDVQGFVDMAEAYLTDSGITKDETSPLYGLAVKMLVATWKDQKVPTGGVDVNAMGFAGILNKLKSAVPAVTT